MSKNPLTLGRGVCQADKKTYFCYLEEDDGKKFEKFQVKSLKATADLIQRNGGKTFTSLDELIEELNKE